MLCFLTQPALYSGSTEAPKSEPKSVVADSSSVEVEVDPEALPSDPPVAESLTAEDGGEGLEPEPQEVLGSDPEVEGSPEVDVEELTVEEASSAAPVPGDGVPEDRLADIEAQIVPDDVAAQENLSLGSPPVVEVGITSPPPDDGEEPVPVEEVIPDPIHIEPLQDPSEIPKGFLREAQTPPVYEKADITSELDNELRDQLDAAEQIIPQVS